MAAKDFKNSFPQDISPRLIAALLILLGFLITTQRRYTYSEPLHGDLTTFAVMGHELLHGKSLYADLIDHSPPARYWTYALAETIAGYGPRAVWLLSLGGAWLLMGAFFAAGQGLTRRVSGGLWAAALYAVISSDLRFQANHPWIELFINACFTGAIALLCPLTEEALTPARWMFAAVLFFLTTLYWQPMAVPVLFVLIAYAFASHRRAGIVQSLFMAGVIVLGWGLVFLGYTLKGTLRAFIDLVFVFNRSYAAYNGTFTERLVKIFTGTGWPAEFHSGTFLFFFPLAGLALYGLFSAWRRGESRTVMLLSAYGIGALIAIALPGTFYPHYFQLILPPLILSARIPSRTVGFLALLLLCLYEGPSYRLTPEQWSIEKYGNEPLVTQRVGRDLSELLAKDETFYNWGTQTGLYFWSRRDPPTGAFYNFYLLTGPSAEALSELTIDDLNRTKPELFIALEPRVALAPQVYENHPIYAWARARYRPFYWPGHMGSFLYLARRGGALEQRILHGQSPATFTPPKKS